MWQRFTERARAAIVAAQKEALQYGDKLVDTEHVLLGVLQAPDSVAIQVLDRLGVSVERVMAALRPQLARRDGEPPKELSLTRAAKNVVDYAYDEARILKNNYIGTEHLLIGLMREENGLAAQALQELRVHLGDVRATVVLLQAEVKRGMWERFSPSSRASIFVSQQEAMAYGERYVNTEHLLLGILHSTENTACQLLRLLGAPPEELIVELRSRLKVRPRKQNEELELTPQAKKATDLAYAEAQRFQSENILVEHLLLGVIQATCEVPSRLWGVIPVGSNMVRDLFRERKITMEAARTAIHTME